MYVYMSPSPPSPLTFNYSPFALFRAQWDARLAEWRRGASAGGAGGANEPSAEVRATKSQI